MSKHTPGPWSYSKAEQGDEFFVYRADDEKRIPITFGGCGCCNTSEQSIELEEDARLIAAAPDLLEALENMLAAFDNPILRRKLQSSFNDEAISSARDARAKAKGESA